MFLTDQQRLDSLGCYGNGYAKTPNLDSLAAQAVKFTHNYVANPICMPSRHTLFSGCYPHNHRVYTNGILPEDTGCNLLHHLQGLGWQTANIGKVHFTPTDSTTPAGQSPESVTTWGADYARYDFHGPYWGFDYLELTVGHARERGHYRQWFHERGGTDDMLEPAKPDPGAAGALPTAMPAGLHVSSFVGERTCNWLRSMRDPEKPFFLVASFPDPHHPFNPPQEILERFAAEDAPMPIGGRADLESRPEHYRKHYEGSWNRMGEEQKPTHANILTEKQTQERIRCIAAMVNLVDQNIGRILDTLRELELEEDTLVLFTSDHGELMGDHGLWLKGPFFYQGLVNTPLLIKMPGTVPRTEDSLISTVDIAPTLCELLGIDIPEYMDGISQAGVLHGTKEKLRDACMVEYRNGYGAADVPSRVIITGRYKYAQYANGDYELTDLLSDPRELKNVADDPEYQLALSEMRRLLLMEILRSEPMGSNQISFA